MCKKINFSKQVRREYMWTRTIYCLGLSAMISVQFSLEMCVAA